MRIHDHSCARTFLGCFLLCLAASGLADPGGLSGTWLLDEGKSGQLGDEIGQLKQEYREWASEHGGINDPDKPSPFEDQRKSDKHNWDSRRAGTVANASVTANRMVSAKALKLYVSDRIVISYDGKLKRLIIPNPAGRVISASGKGIYEDAIGETLAYLDDGALMVETRTHAAERVVERFERTPDDQLKETISIKNPD